MMPHVKLKVNKVQISGCHYAFMLFILVFACKPNVTVPLPHDHQIQDLSGNTEEGAPQDLDEICQREKGKNYLYDEEQNMCLPCSPCQCYHADPLCMKCRNFGILTCATVTQKNVLEETTSPLQTTKLETASPLQTTKSPLQASLEAVTTMATGMPYTTIEVPVAMNTIERVAVGCGVASGVLILILFVWLYKMWCHKKRLPHGEQETQPPDENHPMVILTPDGTNADVAELEG